jgi:hypothetical protein
MPHPKGQRFTVTMPAADSGCGPRDDRAEERGGRGRKRENDGSLTRLAYIGLQQLTAIFRSDRTGASSVTADRSDPLEGVRCLQFMLHHLLLELALRLQPKLIVLALGPPGSLPELASLLADIFLWQR